MNATEKNHARENAAAHLENIRHLFSAYDMLNEEASESEIVDGEEFADTETIEERLREIPLSVQVRSDWHDIGDSDAAAEFELLLATGGPALRIRGDLEDGEATRAYLQYQDWGTPWTDYCGDQEVLLRFARLFYYGSG